MAFRDLSEFLTDQPKRLPVDGKMVEFPASIPARSGTLLLQVNALRDRATTAEEAEKAVEAMGVTQQQWEDLEADVLGKPMADFLADGLTVVRVQHCFQTLTAWHLYGQDAAEAVWDPPQPNRAKRRAPARGQSARQDSTATKPPAPKRKPAAARGGTTSASTGRTSKPTSTRSTASTSKTAR